jgi:hypothetical protein
MDFVALQAKKEHYQSLLREVEHHRMARALGVTDADKFRSFVARFWGWLSRVVSSKVTRSRDSYPVITVNQSHERGEF